MSSDGGVANPRCGGIHAVPQGEGKSFYCRPYLYGRYVTIRSLRSNELLTLCEVEVYSARRGITCLMLDHVVLVTYQEDESSFALFERNRNLQKDVPPKVRTRKCTGY